MTAQLPLAPSLGAPALPHDDAGAWSSTLALVVSVLAATLGLLLAWLLKTRLDRLEARLLDARTSAKDQGGSAGGVLALAVPPPSSRNTTYGRTTAEQAAGVSPTDFSYPPGDCRRFGYDPSGRVDSTAAINTALRVPGEAFLSEGVAKVSAPIRLRSNSTLAGVASGPYNEHDPVRGSQIRPTAAFQGAAVVVLDPATEGAGGAYINGVGLRRFCIDMTAVARRGLIGIQVLSAADPAVFLDLKVMNLDAGNFVYVGQSANPTALQSEGIVFDNLLCLSLGIDPPNADPGVIVEASNEVHFKNGKVDRRSNGQHYPGSVGMLVRPSAKGVTVNAMTSSQMSYAGWETGKKVTSSATAGQGPRWVRANYCTFEGPRYGFAVFGAEGRPSQFCSAIGNRQQTACGDQPAVLYLGDYCCNGTFEQDEEPGYHPIGAKPEYTVYATAKSEGNTIRASPHSGVRDLGLNNLVFGRDPSGALYVDTLSARVITAEKLQAPLELKNSWVQYSPTNRSAVGFWRDPFQCVHLQGHLCGGVPQRPMFTLPLGLRPAKNLSFLVAGAISSAHEAAGEPSYHIVRISEMGDVVQDTPGNNGWVSLDGIIFRVGD